MTSQGQVARSERWLLPLVLVVVLALGLVRIVVAPLWAHYDEPTHFEYVRYVAEHRELPAKSSPDYDILERIAATFGSAQIGGCRERDISAEEAACLRPGHQFGEMPTYYILQAAVQVLVGPEIVEAQVRLARGVSVLLSVLVAWLAYLTVKRVFPDDTLLALGTPLIMALIFAYTDLMSAVNNDVGAVAAFTLMILGVTVVIRNGFRVQTVLLLAAGVALCFLVKSSTWIGVPLAGFGLLLAVWPRLPRAVRIALIAAAVLAVLVAFDWTASGGPQLRSQINQMVPVGDLNRRLRSWYNWGANGPAYWVAIRWQFVSFWSAFSMGVAGLPTWGIAVLAVISGVGAIGLIVALIRHLRAGSLQSDQWRALLFFVAVVATALLMSLLRIDPPDAEGRIHYIPTARHFYIAIVPTVMLLLVGLGAWLPRRGRLYGLALLALLLFALGVWSVLAVQVPWFVANWPVPY